MKRCRTLHFTLAIAVLLTIAAVCQAEEQTYTKEEIRAEVEGFFEGTTAELAEIVEKVFREHGRPNGYIKGGEGGGAIVVGLRYGEGTLQLKSGATRKLFWQGPSVGFDWGGNASKVFTLVYRLENPDDIYQRFPGVDGSAYLVGGFSLNYQKSGQIVLAPIRTGVGLRLGASVGYLHYTRKKHINPF
jgi:hypothetical protein